MSDIDMTKTVVPCKECGELTHNKHSWRCDACREKARAAQYPPVIWAWAHRGDADEGGWMRQREEVSFDGQAGVFQRAIRDTQRPYVPKEPADALADAAARYLAEIDGCGIETPRRFKNELPAVLAAYRGDAS